MKQLRARLRIILLAGVVVFLLGGWLAPAARALPPRPSPPLPPLPDRPQGSTSDEQATPPRGATIELIVESGSPALWTIVQWQDGLGGWHNVEGWQGTLDDGTHKVWWVDAADLGKGPFRWLVELDDGMLAVSEPFDLPAAAGESVKRFVSIAP